MKQADFYILSSSDAEGKYQFLGKLLTRILSGGHRIFLVCDEQFAAETLANSLWQFSECSFLANSTPDQSLIAPITIGWDLSHQPEHLDVIVNYSQSIPPSAADFERVVELVSADADSLTRSRERYKSYKEQGFTIKHNDMRNR